MDRGRRQGRKLDLSRASSRSPSTAEYQLMKRMELEAAAADFWRCIVVCMHTQAIGQGHGHERRLFRSIRNMRLIVLVHFAHLLINASSLRRPVREACGG